MMLQHMNQLCKVCGEPAAGFHFGAFTCEGCKSFFGRTYNNLSQIHECKNGGACVINKQNRTSCKACRLRKCLFVGMSKTGSRYGRRSNWFKIHCLLQEKAAFVGQPANFRSPVTPTLQDGSLPFVATQMREPGVAMDAPVSMAGDVTTASVTNPVSTYSHTSGIGINTFGVNDMPRLGPTLHPSSSLSPSERKYQEEILNRSTHASGVPFPLSGNYRNHVLSLLQRTRGYDAITHHQDLESPPDDFALATIDERLRANPILDWERRFSRKTNSEGSAERKSPSSPIKETILDSPIPPKIGDPRITIADRETPTDDIHLSAGSKNHLIDNNNTDAGVIITTAKEEEEEEDEEDENQEKNFMHDNKPQEPIMTDEERLSFLKSANSMANSMRGIRVENTNGRINSPLRFPGREELLYNPVNNNLFSFPPYPPLWPSMLPFSPFSKFYSPFCPPRVSAAVGFEPLKPPSFPLFNAFDQRNPFPAAYPKEDPEMRKRLLDDILSIQRHNRSPTDRSPLGSPSIPTPSGSLVSTPQESRIPCTDGRTPISLNQPIDLSIRRKRKMDKSEIIYKPGDDIEEMESELDKDNKEDKSEESDRMELKVTEINPIVTAESFVEAPTKVIKLETNNEALAT